MLVVSGLLLAGLTQGSRMVLQFTDRQRVLLGAIDDLDAIDRALRAVIEQMEPNARLDQSGVSGSVDSLQFTSRLPPWRDDLRTRRADVRLLLDGRQRLVLRWAPRPHVEERPRPTSDLVLLTGVTGLVFSYRAAGPDAAWRSEWHDRALPALIRIHLVFPRGDPRNWPDIIAAPMRPHGVS